MTNRESIIDSYDDFVWETREAGVSYYHAVDALTAERADKFAGHSLSGLDVPELIYDSVRLHIQTTRSNRRQNLRDLFDDLGDKRDFPEGTKQYVAATRRLEANFARAFPLGVDAGTDKALGMWSIDDVRVSMESRRENVKRQQMALRNFEAAAGRAITALREGVTWA